MTIELTYLAWTLVLALVQIILAAHFRTGETGLKYNLSPRDRPSPVPERPITSRLIRARNNLLETLPIFMGAVLIAHLADIHNTATIWGATLYVCGRIAYVPFYAYGVPYARSVAWTVSMIGILMLILSILINS